VDNIASLLRISGLLPAHLDIQPLLEDAKRQLRDEADYNKEAQFLQAFGDLLRDDPRFVVPEVLPDLTRRTVLAMTYASGYPIETIVNLPQADRVRVMSALIELMFMVLFELRMVQTDPIFANYLYRASSGQIVLLDFGATRRFKAAFANDYRRLLAAAMSDDTARLVRAAERIGYSMGDEDSEYRALVLELFILALEPLRHEGSYDFARSDMARRMSELAQDVADYKDFWRAPPTDAMYFHRKLGGMFLLASRVKARGDVRAIVTRWLP
jgi:predicted unusual protein kinase regulating ubiquinone biosynthesis (AarF/ABC1/UbiB family)